MKLLQKPGKQVSVRKATNYAIVINALQIGLILVMLGAIAISPAIKTSYRLLMILTIVASLVIIWGAIVDIREALHTRRLLVQLDDMDSTIDAMSQFNNTLRAQRHDFLNHLQVVYSLIEMAEYQRLHRAGLRADHRRQPGDENSQSRGERPAAGQGCRLRAGRRAGGCVHQFQMGRAGGRHARLGDVQGALQPDRQRH